MCDETHKDDQAVRTKQRIEMRRRDFLRLASGTVALGAPVLAAPNIARAQAAWPDKPVRIIVPFAAGGGTDLVARPWADKLSQAFRQQFIVENRGGASGLIGAEAAAKSAPDGSTFLVAAATSSSRCHCCARSPMTIRAFKLWGGSVTSFAASWSTPQSVRRHSKR
jgi:tripartite-type tricarboxylate transporter receptor subunit TctC